MLSSRCANVAAMSPPAMIISQGYREYNFDNAPMKRRKAPEQGAFLPSQPGCTSAEPTCAVGGENQWTLEPETSLMRTLAIVRCSSSSAASQSSFNTLC